MGHINDFRIRYYNSSKLLADCRYSNKKKITTCFNESIRFYCRGFIEYIDSWFAFQ
jgi:hypothetical protein